MEERNERRGFLLACAGAIAAVPLLGGAFTALRAILSPAGGSAEIRQELCKLSEVPAEGLLERTVSYRLRRGPAVETVSRTVFLTRDAGEVVALSSRCTHLGCSVTLDKESPEAPLICPCHDGRFDAKGAVIDGPATRPLERLTLEVPEEEDGTILLVL
ncbi:MAG: QcrA and Rieske domain-containing protein [Planctomycetota bacterium]